MFGLLKHFFSREPSATASCCFRNYWCRRGLKLPTAVRTPLGSRVRVLDVCVDIWYRVCGSDIQITRVRLAQEGGLLGRMRINVAASRLGEAWMASSICRPERLKHVVSAELADETSPLRGLMLAKWRGERFDEAAEVLIRRLNGSPDASSVSAAIEAGAKGVEITFCYTKPHQTPEVRHVAIVGTRGQCLMAIDKKDQGIKNFHLDRISEARLDSTR